MEGALVGTSVLAAGGLYVAGLRRWDAGHPREPFPRWREASLLGGLVLVVGALTGPVADQAHVRFSMHMVQHLLLTLAAPPLILLGRPLMVARRTAPSPIRRALARSFRSAPGRALANPVLGWALLAVVLWASHFTSLYAAAIRSEAVHVGEHALYLGAGLLFWFPVAGAEPSPWRLGPAARVGYLFLALPANAFLALALYAADRVLYAPYAGPNALADQRAAAAVMWVGGGLLLAGAVLLVTAAWARVERRA